MKFNIEMNVKNFLDVTVYQEEKSHHKRNK